MSPLFGELLDYCEEQGIRDIQLFCARGKRPFYEKRGFFARPEDASGMQFSVTLRHRRNKPAKAK